VLKKSLFGQKHGRKLLIRRSKIPENRLFQHRVKRAPRRRAVRIVG
jgi:hypothetical protein